MKIRTNVNLDDKIKQQIKKKADKLGTSMSRIIERLARNFLKKLK